MGAQGIRRADKHMDKNTFLPATVLIEVFEALNT
jgi:hypothetical protein